MKVNRVEIKNFRSIKDGVIQFFPKFQILVGINESGKSNILKALSCLNKDAVFTKDDIRDPGHEEEAVILSYIRYVFRLSHSEISSVVNNAHKLVLSKSKKEAICYIGDTGYTVPQYRIPPHWKKPKANTKCMLSLGQGTEELCKYSFVNTKDYPGIPADDLEDIDIAFLNSQVGALVRSIAETSCPACMVWQYNEKNLLPEKINITQFMSDPTFCYPLKNMFALAGFPDVSKTLKEAEVKTNGMRNVLRKVSENTTSHMRKVWPEWKKQKVTLSQNGENIEAGIEDEYNVYSLSRRSDGFKRFFTFLLMVSAQSQTEDIQDNIILIDEPEIGLHPTGISYIQKELKKISQANHVFVSTHSIFMIDKEEISRHSIVEKHKEITVLKNAATSDVSDEEVIYKALGFSTFELLKPVNIIFEGWRDKKVLQLYLFSKENKTTFTKNFASNLGFLHAVGVKDVARIINICENFGRDFLVVTDSDKVAQEKKRVCERKDKWVLYNEIDGVSSVTTEDFIRVDLINKCVDIIYKEYNINPIFKLEANTNKMDLIKKDVEKKSHDSSDIQTILNKIKQLVVEKLTAKDILPEYALVVEHLKQRLYKHE